MVELGAEPLAEAGAVCWGDLVLSASPDMASGNLEGHEKEFNLCFNL